MLERGHELAPSALSGLKVKDAVNEAEGHTFFADCFRSRMEEGLPLSGTAGILSVFYPERNGGEE